MTCSVDVCDRPVLARGLCHNHYQQARNKKMRAAIVHPPCEFCGGEIAGDKNKNARFCSVVCKQKSYDAARASAARQRRAAAVRKCGWCKEPLSELKRWGARFCSELCSDRWNNNVKALMALQAKKAARMPCEVCGQPIPESRPIGAVYCSQKCKIMAAKSKSPAATAAQRDANLVRLYGITTADMDAIFASQDFRCAICRATETTGKGWHLDHDHVTGKVRGVLCHGCNLMLGNAQDDPVRLRAAAAYLERS